MKWTMLKGTPAIVYTHRSAKWSFVGAGIVVAHFALWLLLPAYRGTWVQVCLMALFFACGAIGQVLFWGRVRVASKESKAGYTTLYRGVKGVAVVDYKTGCVIAVAGEGELEPLELERRVGVLRGLKVG